MQSLKLLQPKVGNPIYSWSFEVSKLFELSFDCVLVKMDSCHFWLRTVGFFDFFYPGAFMVLFLCVCVWVFVCPQATGHSFWRRNLINKKRNFLFFEILIFGPLRALFRPFSSIFFFILCKSSVRATSHTDRLTNLIFGTESLYDTITWGFQRFLKICISAPFIFKKGPKSQKT